MAERLVSIPLWQNQHISGGAATSGFATSIYNFGKDVLRAETLMYQASAATSAADIGFYYAISPDGVALGSYADNTALLACNVTTTNNSGWHAIALPNFLAPYVAFSVSGLASNPTDTRVWATLVLRMN